MTATINVHNLRTGDTISYVGITPEQAVIAAYAQGRKDYATDRYQARYGHLVQRGRHSVAVGDYAAKASA